jgi:hypothetical protein
MANYYGAGRTNYFKVKNIAKFEKDLAKYGQDEILFKKTVGRGKLVAIIPQNDDDGFPWDYVDENDDYQDIPWGELFKAHLADDWVAIIQEVGNEKMRYLAGYAYAYNNKGETVELNLNDLKHFKNLGKNITGVEY